MCDTPIDLCVVDLCTYFDPPAPLLCAAIKEKVLDVNTFYLVSDIIYQESKAIFSDVPTTISTEVENWYRINTIVYFVPFFIITLVLFIYLIASGTVGWVFGLLLMFGIFILFLGSIVYILYGTYHLTNDLPDILTTQIEANYEARIPEIKCAIINALIDPSQITCLT